MNENNDIDKLFREQASSFKAKVPDGSWNKISGTLMLYKRMRLLWIGASSLSAILILLVLGYFVTKPDSNTVKTSMNSQIPSQKNIQKSTISPNSKTSFTENQTVELVSKVEPTTIPNVNSNKTIGIKSEKSIKKQKETKNISSPKEYNNTANVGKIDFSIASIKQDSKLIQPSTNKEEIKTENNLNSIENVIEPKNTNAIVIETKSQDSIVEIKSETQPNTQQIAIQSNPTTPPIIPTVPTVRFNPVLFVSVMVGPSFTYRNKGATSQVHTQTRTTSDEWLPSFNALYELGFNLNSKFSISTGIQKGKYGSISNFVITDPYMQYIHIDEFGAASSGIFNANRIDNLMQNSGLSSVEKIKKFDKIKTVFDYLDFPLTVFYTKPLNNKMSFSVGTGINLSLIKTNSVSVRKEIEWYQLGTVENVREQLFGMNANISFNYSLTGGFQLFGISRYRHYFQSINLDNEFIYKPYAVDLQVGLRYIFE